MNIDRTVSPLSPVVAVQNGSSHDDQSFQRAVDAYVDSLQRETDASNLSKAASSGMPLRRTVVEPEAAQRDRANMMKLIDAVADARTCDRGARDTAVPVQGRLLDIASFRMLIGHNAVFARELGLQARSTSDTEPSGLVSGYALRGLHLEAAAAGTLLSELANKVNRKAIFSVFESGDAVTVVAENRAARNMARAYAGLIHARVTKSIGFGAPTVRTQHLLPSGKIL